MNRYEATVRLLEYVTEHGVAPSYVEIDNTNKIKMVVLHWQQGHNQMVLRIDNKNFTHSIRMPNWQAEGRATNDNTEFIEIVTARSKNFENC